MASLLEILEREGRFQTLLGIAIEADVIDVLKNPGSHTVLAPNDEAFARLSKGTLASWLGNAAKLKKIVTYHILFGDVRSDDLQQTDEAPTLEGSIVAVDNSEGIKINNANILQADILADNGVIHIIDKVLMPAIVAGRV